MAWPSIPTADPDVDSLPSVTESVGSPRVVSRSDIGRGTVLAERYQVEALIGRGGSGEVFRAWDRVVETAVALKILDSALARDPVWIERVARELRVARLIQHANLCRIHEVDRTEDGRRFLTMELAPGGSLRESLADAGRPLAQRISDARDAVRGLAALHTAQIVHRDVKPENLLRMSDGRLVLSDFGLAAVPHATMSRLVGTPSYMAPELAMGEPASFRSDVWSLGVVLHEILFGARPTWRQSEDGPRVVMPEDARSGRVRRALFRLVAACVHGNPSRRPADASQVERLLAVAERGSTPRLRGAVRHRNVGWALLAAGVVLGAFSLRGRMWTQAGASGAARASVTLSGEPADWSRASRVVASHDGRIHCLSALADGRLRVVWGSPRAAEDLDPATGSATASQLRSETFQQGCPQLSPDGQHLLFGARDGSGRTEVMYSSLPDGSAAVPVVSGFDPLWLPSGAEFAFCADESHVGIFSLPVMRMQLLDDRVAGDGFGDGMAVDPRGMFLVKTLISPQSELSTGVVQDLASRKVLSSFDVPMRIWHPRIGRDGQLLFWAREQGRDQLVKLDLKTMRGIRLGMLPGADPAHGALLADGQLAFVQQVIESDVYRVKADATVERVTFDGNSYAPAMGPRGDMLLQRRTPDNRVVIGYMPAPGRPARVLTDGPLDGNPAFLPDGRRWVYSSFDRSSIMVCELRPGTCRTLHHDDMMPAWPAVSPDGAQLAYVTTRGARLRLSSIVEGKTVRDLGPARLECPPFWSSPARVWVMQGPDDAREWVELDLRTGPTGQRRHAPPATELDQGCQIPAELGAPSPGVRELRRYQSKIRLVRPE